MAHQSPVTAIIVGGGHRAFIYASYAQKHPDELKIVGIADPDADRCQTASRNFARVRLTDRAERALLL